MNNRRRLLSELKKISEHFRLKLSKIEIVRKTAIALDDTSNKLLIIDETDHPYFKTIDLQNVKSCAIKVDYGKINAGDLRDKNIDTFIEKIQLQIAHVDPVKSVYIRFYDTGKDSVHDLRTLVSKARSWRDKITSILPASQLLRA